MSIDSHTNSPDESSSQLTAPPIPDPAPISHPPETPDTIRLNPTDPDTTSQFALPIFTPDRPQPATLTPRQLAAVALLTSGKTVSSVAAMLKIHRSTLHAWKQLPDFAAELQSRRTELRDTIDARLYRILLHATHSAIASLRVNDIDASHRNAFRLLAVLRPWMPRMDALLCNPHGVPESSESNLAQLEEAR
jgi:hypothetical protein